MNKLEKNEWIEQAKANARILEDEIQKLSSGHWDWLERQYKDFWSHAKQISKLFKELKPLKKEDRERLWSNFNYICEDIKRKQNEEWEKRLYKSKEYKNLIMDTAYKARVNTFFGFDPPDVEDMKRLGQVLKESSSLLSEYKSDMLGEHKKECFELIKEIRSEHDAWWAELKKYRSRKREEFIGRVRSNLEKNHERHRKATDFLEHLRRKADDLRNNISTAWNDDWAYKAEGWLSELEDKMRDVEDQILRIEEWIREDEQKLN